LFVVTGATGQVGRAVVRTLLESGQRVGAVVRSPENALACERQGCEPLIADMNDAEALQRAFSGTEGVFVMLPPLFDPSPDFPEARQLVQNLRTALASAQPPRVVCLSTIGAQASETNLLTQLQILEQQLSTLALPLAFVRAAWFMENSAWDVAPARDTGLVPSFLQPLDKLFPMVATADVGSTAARLLLESWQGRRIVELEGPERISPNQIAATFARLLDRDVRMQVVPHESWDALFRSQGMKNPMPRIRMLEGLNQGWIEFEGGSSDRQKGSTNLEEVLHGLVARVG